MPNQQLLVQERNPEYIGCRLIKEDTQHKSLPSPHKHTCACTYTCVPSHRQVCIHPHTYHTHTHTYEGCSYCLHQSRLRREDVAHRMERVNPPQRSTCMVYTSREETKAVLSVYWGDTVHKDTIEWTHGNVEDSNTSGCVSLHAAPCLP